MLLSIKLKEKKTEKTYPNLDAAVTAARVLGARVALLCSAITSAARANRVALNMVEREERF